MITIMIFDHLDTPMTLDQLMALDAIVQTGTFRAAAEHLHKSQSAISHMIKVLEDEAGAKLLSREDYRPTLTAEGRQFYAQASRVLHHARALKSTAHSLAADEETEIGIAYSETIPSEALVAAIEQVHQRFPATHIRLYKEMMGGALARLMEEKAQIILSSMAGIESDQVEAIPYRATTILPVAHPDFEPARIDSLKTIGDMYSYTQIVVADTSEGRFTQSRDVLSGSYRMTVSDFAMKKALIVSKQGWGGLPCYLVRDDVAAGRLKILAIDGFPPRRTRVYKIRRRDRAIGKVAAALWQALGTYEDQALIETGPGCPASMTNLA